MKKFLFITNIITLAILFAIVIRHFRFILNDKSTQPQIEKKISGGGGNCQYRLEYFDFHFERESQNPKIIMLGNSLIRHGNWDSLLQRKDVINRGISGDRLECICERLKYLKETGANICFIEGGINDIPGQSLDSLFGYYKRITDFWISQHKIPVINLLLYISPKAGETFPSRKNFKAINDSVEILNYRLLQFAVNRKIDVIDLNQKISNNKQKVLLDEFTTDGVHLQPQGYSIWEKEIRIILKKYKI